MVRRNVVFHVSTEDMTIFWFLDSTDSALQMFTDGVDEFFKCFMDSINAVLINESQDRNVQLHKLNGLDTHVK